MVVDVRPETNRMMAENRTRPATKADSMTRTRVVAAFIYPRPSSETCDKTCADHLEKNRAAIMRPERNCAGDRQNSQHRQAQQERMRHSARSGGLRHFGSGNSLFRSTFT